MWSEYNEAVRAIHCTAYIAAAAIAPAASKMSHEATYTVEFGSIVTFLVPFSRGYTIGVKEFAKSGILLTLLQDALVLNVCKYPTKGDNQEEKDPSPESEERRRYSGNTELSGFEKNFGPGPLLGRKRSFVHQDAEHRYRHKRDDGPWFQDGLNKVHQAKYADKKHPRPPRGIVEVLLEVLSLVRVRRSVFSCW